MQATEIDEVMDLVRLMNVWRLLGEFPNRSKIDNIRSYREAAKALQINFGIRLDLPKKTQENANDYLNCRITRLIEVALALHVTGRRYRFREAVNDLKSYGVTMRMCRTVTTASPDPIPG